MVKTFVIWLIVICGVTVIFTVGLLAFKVISLDIALWVIIPALVGDIIGIVCVRFC